ncbi:hypothetical protein [Candidatus Poriferisodalis sp.]|uniref:hypothetical protein n=1 Tax=Candidatus Poriferisodalis sp. TaxID=3101277 RepID=UPI003B529F7D
MSAVETLVTGIFSSVIIALLIAMFVSQRRQLDQMRNEMAEFKAEMRAEIAELRAEFKAECTELRRAVMAVEKDTAMLIGRLLPEDEVLSRITNRPEPVS